MFFDTCASGEWKTRVMEIWLLFWCHPLEKNCASVLSAANLNLCVQPNATEGAYLLADTIATIHEGCAVQRRDFNHEVPVKRNSALVQPEPPNQHS